MTGPEADRSWGMATGSGGKGIEDDDDSGERTRSQAWAGERLREAPALQVPEYVAAARLPGHRRLDHDHAVLPLLRGGGGHAAAAALLPHVVPVLLVPPGGLQRDRRLQRVHRG